MEFHYYAALILAGTLLISLYLIRRLRGIESQRRTRLQKRDEYDATPDALTQSISNQEIGRSRLKALAERFGLFRRLALILVWLAGLLLLLFPAWRNQSPVFASFMLAAGSVVVGIAAKPIIENLICGIVLAFGGLVRIGDTVLVDGEYGIVEKVTSTHCVIKRWDWLRYTVPNVKMLNKEFVNYSLYDNHRWVHVEFWVDYTADLNEVEEIARAAPRGSPYCSDAEDTRFWVVEMAKDGVKCMAVAWATQPSDGWMLSMDMRTLLVQQFQARGVPTHRLHIATDHPNVSPAP